jgi:RNA polymerase sigma factor (sigma-70 family)
MPTRTLTQLASRLRREPSAVATAEETDRDLLGRFLDEQDEEAFEALVRRHDRLVRSAITKVLPDAHDAEDAFQATFLVLVRRAKSIDWRPGLGPWLYGVAHRVAVKARDAGRTRGRKEKEAGAKPSDPGSALDLSWREACALLHAELDKLPDRYRLPLLLCYLEGKTRDEAATALKVTAATVKGRLERGREVLRDRLARRGVTLSAGLLVAVAGGRVGASSPSAVAGVLEVVRGAVPARVLALTRETTASALLAKMAKTGASVLGLIAVASAMLAAGAPRPSDDPPKREPTPTRPAGDAPTDPKPKDGAPAPGAVTIRGHLIGPDKRSEPGATVAVWGAGKKLGETTTTKDNMFQVTVPGPLPNGAKVVATKPGFAPDWATVPADPEKRWSNCGRFSTTARSPVASPIWKGGPLRTFPWWSSASVGPSPARRSMTTSG